MTKRKSIHGADGFTLIELLVVIAVIAILAALIISVNPHSRSASARAQSEIQALSAACESYKADNGDYPHQALAVSGSIPVSTNPPPSDLLDPRTMGNSSQSNSVYTNAALELYEALTGDLSFTGTTVGAHNYIADMRPDVWGRPNPDAAISPSNPVSYLKDPFGNCYGYSTANSTAVTTGSSYVPGYTPPTTDPGYNPTFDLWSTGGITTPPNTGAQAGQPGDPTLQWIRNW